MFTRAFFRPFRGSLMPAAFAGIAMDAITIERRRNFATAMNGRAADYRGASARGYGKKLWGASQSVRAPDPPRSGLCYGWGEDDGRSGSLRGVRTPSRTGRQALSSDRPIERRTPTRRRDA